MSNSIEHRAFFGDAERTFRLTPKLIVELERKTEVGIGALCQRLFQNQFRHADMIETIRLALIGGGAKPEEAASLVAAYAEGQPLSETHFLTVNILSALWFGSKPETERTADA